MRTNAWTEALPRVLPLLVSLRKVRFSGQMYLDTRHRVRSGVQGVLAQLTSLTLDGVFFSSLAELTMFFQCVPHLKRLAVNVIAAGRGDNDDDVHMGGLCRAGDSQSRDRASTCEMDALPLWERRHYLVGESERVGLSGGVGGG